MSLFQRIGIAAIGATSTVGEDFVLVDNYKAVPKGAVSAAVSSIACEHTCQPPGCSQWFFNKKDSQCHTSHDATWKGEASDHGISGCLPSLVAGCPTAPRPSPAPPTPSPPAPTPPSPLPGLEHKQSVSPVTFKGSVSQGAGLRGKFYFLPPSGSSAFIVYDSTSQAWDSLEINASSGVLSMLSGGSLAAVSASTSDFDDYLVVSGGGTKNVLALNMRTKQWKAMAEMQNSQSNSCSVGCQGFWMSMTGDMKKAEVGLTVSKPANRQEYRYNLTSGEHFEVNGEKQRGGAGCACDEAANAGAGRAFWAGGYSNSGLTTQVEMWQVNPNKRGGQPIFKMSAARRDVGAAVCGGRLIVAGGTDAMVDVFNSSSTADGERVTLKLSKNIPSPRIGCVGNRVALIAGGSQTDVFVLNIAALPKEGETLHTLPVPLSGSGRVAVATDAKTGHAMFFDGQHADFFYLSSADLFI